MADITFIRANLHDITGAIPRAIEASSGLFEKVRILCWNRSDIALKEPEVVAGAEIRRYSRQARPRSLATVLDILRFGVWVVRQLLRDPPKYVQVCDLESALPAMIASLWTRSVMIYDMRDPFAESYRFPRWVKPVAYAADWTAMAASRAFVVPAEERIPYLGRWSKRRLVAVVRNACHDELSALGSSPATLPRRRSSSTIRLAYLGYLVSTRGAEWLIELCREEQGGVELWVAGLCRSEKLQGMLAVTSEAHWFGLLPRMEALRLMREADAVSLLYDPSVPVNRIAAPNKFYEALMTSTPVLVSRGMSLAEEVEREGLGFVLTYGDLTGLREAISELRDADLRARLRQRCRQYFLDHCRLDQDLDQYRDFYRSLLNPVVSPSKMP